MRKLQRGERIRGIPQESWNAFVDAARAHQASQQSQKSATVQLGSTRANTVLVRNDSGADRAAFEVLGIQGFIIDPSVNFPGWKSQLAFIGVLPIAAGEETGGELHTDNTFVVLAEPIKSGRFGKAWAHGLCPVKVLIDDTTHRFAKPLDSVATNLTTAESGVASILWRDDGAVDTVVWAVIRWGATGGTAAASELGVVRSVLADRYTWQRIRYANNPPVIGQYEAYGDVEEGYPLPTIPLSYLSEFVFTPATITTDAVPIRATQKDGVWLLELAPKFEPTVLEPGEEMPGCDFA